MQSLTLRQATSSAGLIRLVPSRVTQRKAARIKQWPREKRASRSQDFFQFASRATYKAKDWLGTTRNLTKL